MVELNVHMPESELDLTNFWACTNQTFELEFQSFCLGPPKIQFRIEH